MAAELLVLDERYVRFRPIEGDLVGRPQRRGPEDVRVALARVLHASWNLDEDLLVLVRDRVFDRCELVLYRVADLDHSLAAGDLDVDRHDGRLLDVADDRSDDLEPGPAGLPHQDLAERVLCSS